MHFKGLIQAKEKSLFRFQSRIQKDVPVAEHDQDDLFRIWGLNIRRIQIDFILGDKHFIQANPFEC